MTISQMRKLTLPTCPSSALRWTTFGRDATPRLPPVVGTSTAATAPTRRSLAQVRHDPVSEVWFTPSIPAISPADGPLATHGSRDHKPPDEKRLKLGKSTHPLNLLSPCNRTDLFKRSGRFRLFYPTFSRPRSRPKSYLLPLSYISFHQPILICPVSAGKCHTEQRYGQLQ